MGARGAKQKQKLLYLAKIMLEQTDEMSGWIINEKIICIGKRLSGILYKFFIGW